MRVSVNKRLLNPSIVRKGTSDQTQTSNNDGRKGASDQTTTQKNKRGQEGGKRPNNNQPNQALSAPPQVPSPSISTCPF